MSRLIDADALMKAMYHRAFETDGDTMWQSGCWVRYRAIEQVVKEQPTIEARKKGKWIYYPKASGSVTSTAVHLYPVCSECGCEHPIANYCSNCGADMREGAKQE